MKDVEQVLLSISARNGGLSSVANNLLMPNTVQNVSVSADSTVEELAKLCSEINIPYTEDLRDLATSVLRYLQVNDVDSDVEALVSSLPLDMELVADAKSHFAENIKGTSAASLAMLYSTPAAFNSTYEDNYAFASLLLSLEANNPPKLWQDIVTFRGRVLYV